MMQWSFKQIVNECRMAAGAEISMEADPGTFDAQRLRNYMALGVSRFSIGVQAFQQVSPVPQPQVSPNSEAPEVSSKLQHLITRMAQSPASCCALSQKAPMANLCPLPCSSH